MVDQVIRPIRRMVADDRVISPVEYEVLIYVCAGLGFSF